MTYKEFHDWAERRAMDGNWSPFAATITCHIMNLLHIIPRRKREMAWERLLTIMGRQNDVPPVPVGKTVYMLLDDTDEETDPISEEVVTEVGTRGFWLSSCVPARNDMGTFVPWSEVGERAFFSHTNAVEALKFAREVTQNGVD